MSGPPHLGHIAGMTLPADIFARYHRMAGNDVLMVSGSDMHGTPTTLKAEQEGVTPDVIANRFDEVYRDVYRRFGFEFDLYTTTETENHHAVAREFFSKLLENGHLYEAAQSMPYCEKEERFLSDRFVEGTCPYCGFDQARGDQCDNCGKILDAPELIGIRCKADGTTPVFRDTSHYLFRLGNFRDRLEEWVQAQDHWRPQVRNLTLGMLREGLPDRAMTRDIDWGVPVPVDGYEAKRIYVWFEALIGYLSATVEWASKSGDSEAWKRWWHNPEARSYYFQGKDNTPFHTIFWPAMLLGYGGDPAYQLPYDVSANEFLNFEGGKQSTSRNWAVWAQDALDRYDADALRYYLAATMPETSDSEFRWATFVSRNNDELVATLGNFVHRVLTLTHRNFGGEVPEPGPLDEHDNEALTACESALETTAGHLEGVHLREGLRSLMALAQHGNRYINGKAPWKTVKTDRERTATTLWTALNIVATLRTLCYPYIPHSASKMHRLIGADGDVLGVGWKCAMPEPGAALPEPEALFRKLDESVVAEEMERLSPTGVA